MSARAAAQPSVLLFTRFTLPLSAEVVTCGSPADYGAQHAVDYLHRRLPEHIEGPAWARSPACWAGDYGFFAGGVMNPPAPNG